MAPAEKHIAIVGGGPSGLHAAERCAAGGARVSVFDAKRSVGRKLLVAGYGGLNLTHGEPLETFVTRYSGPGLPAHFAATIREFTPSDLREWAAGLGIETFEQRTGRVYPREMKAAPLLRRWIERLRAQGVTFHVNHRLIALHPGPQLTFNHGPPRSFDAVILALGGASWPKTGSDGSWPQLLRSHEVDVTPFQPANCGWNAGWPDTLVPELEGRPLKNISATAGDTTISGELMLTRYGIEGGAIYQLGPALRAMKSPAVTIDLKPGVPEAALLRKMESVRHDFLRESGSRWKLPPHARILLDNFHGPFPDTASLGRAAKALTIPLTGPRPIDEAISSAGGIAWPELGEHLGIIKLPGFFVCGEMIDWEAPTGGYLIQACFATGARAAKGALAFAKA